MTTSAVSEPQAGEPSAFGRALVLATTTSATALYAMTITIANVALPQIRGALSATQDQIAWVVTFNIIATAVVTPTTGWLATRFGRRNVMLFGVLGFTVATFLCGIANSLAELVIYRVLQGAFGAPLVPLSQAIVLDTYPRERHGSATAIFGMGVVLGPIFAPTLGGYLAEWYGWRWVFFMIVPIGLMCLVGVWGCIRDRVAPGRLRLDWTGLVALAVSIICLQLVLDRGERNGWFESPETILEASVAVLAFYVFVVHTFTHDHPFLSPRLLLDRNFSVGLLITLIFGMLNFTPMVLLPPMMKELQGYPDSVLGLLLGARAVGTMAGFIVMLFASHLDPRLWLATGFGLQAAAGFVMTGFNVEVTTWDVAWTSAMQGLGVGLLWVPITLVTFATLDQRHLNEGTAIFHLLRNIGSSIHISLSVAIVVHTAKINYAELVESISPFNEMLAYPSLLGAWSLDSTSSLAALSGEIRRQAVMVGYVNAFYMYGFTSLAVLPLIALVRPRKR